MYTVHSVYYYCTVHSALGFESCYGRRAPRIHYIYIDFLRNIHYCVDLQILINHDDGRGVVSLNGENGGGALCCNLVGRRYAPLLTTDPTLAGFPILHGIQ